MRYEVRSPVRDYAGEVAGVRFDRGRAVVDGDRRRALAYFRRRGYTVTAQEPEPEPEAAPEAEAGAVKRPAAGSVKADWVAYVAATAELSEAEADAMTKSELIALADSEGDG